MMPRSPCAQRLGAASAKAARIAYRLLFMSETSHLKSDCPMWLIIHPTADL
jgi:hypothetical protein